MNRLDLTINYESYTGLEQLNDADKALCIQAEEALKSSYSPYSNFKVGTAIRLNNGQVVFGSNQENVAYPSGLCAERVALFTIGVTYPDAEVESMAITAHTENFTIINPVTSCGACLQVMAEVELRQKKEIEVLFYCLNGKVLKLKGVKSLLPFAFFEDRLAV
ncbi:cytidine deaminase [Pedobacter sp.]|uniref:cytidine deaminase n=1 Tax=Pedobacter sp. TaxID=1411316 RepID=UPI003D7F5510